jgi:hypothetical protein
MITEDSHYIFDGTGFLDELGHLDINFILFVFIAIVPLLILIWLTTIVIVLARILHFNITRALLNPFVDLYNHFLRLF